MVEGVEKSAVDKTEERAARKAAQKAEKAAKIAAKQEVKPEERELTPGEYYAHREAQIARLGSRGEAYPHKWPVNSNVAEFVAKYAHLKDEETAEERVVLAGRVMRVAPSGSKLRFYTLSSDGARVQVMFNFAWGEGTEEDFAKLHDGVHRGDILGVAGKAGRTKRGELSVFATEARILSYCMYMLPDRGLRDKETRYRQRYLDLICNPESLRIFQLRSRVIQHIRAFFTKRGFLEVETPTLNIQAGGANARPFVTRHHELNTEMFLRVAPELPLKMLTVGGLERVFEIGKNFRNEGCDATHNPEFTALEFYWAYADYEDVMALSTELISGVVKEITGSYILEYEARDDITAPAGATRKIDFTPPFERIPLMATLEKHLGTIPRPYDSPETNEFLLTNMKRVGVPLPAIRTTARLIDACCGHLIESGIRDRPAYITDHPQLMCALAKWHRADKELTERLELFVNGAELVNAYTELNDPQKQRETFAQADQEADDEVQGTDAAFCRALDYGLPPTGGFGLGIDRLVMTLANARSIRDVILFPTMKVDHTKKGD